VNGNADGDANGGVGVSSNVVSLEAPERPLVVFCSNCKTILGDTNSFVCTHAELKTITLRSAYSVKLTRDEVETPTKGLAAGSTFHRIYCDSCAQCVGKVFLSTTRDLDPMRDVYTFDSKAIRSYELSEGRGSRGGAHDDAGGGQQASAVLAERLEVLETQMLKVENLMLLFNERIDVLEDWKALKSL